MKFNSIIYSFLLVFYGNGDSELKPLKNNKSIKLKHGDTFSLTQSNFKYQVELDGLEQTKSNGNSTNLTNETETELKNGNGEAKANKDDDEDSEMESDEDEKPKKSKKKQQVLLEHFK